MKRTILRATAAALAVLAPVTAASVALPAADAASVSAQTKAAGIAPAEVHIGKAGKSVITPHIPAEESKWRKIIKSYQKAGYPVQEVYTYSPSMNRVIPLVLIRPTDKAKRDNAPTVYLLNGADGGEGRANWLAQTDIIEYWGGNEGKRKDQKKSVQQSLPELTSPGIGANIVIPMSGAFSYYSDWKNQNAALQGKDKNGNPSGKVQNWETYMTRELPQALEPKLNANGKRAIVGMSMTGTTSLLYAQHHPGFYDSVGSFSGCAATTTPLPSTFIDITLDRGGASMAQMWGGKNTATARYNDALLNAHKLRGQGNIYVSNGSGLGGQHDMPWSPRVNGNLLASGVVMAEGGAIEAATNSCTVDLKRRTDRLGIPVRYNLRPYGTHQWGYWQDDTRDYWRTLVNGLGTGAVKPNAKQDPNHPMNGNSASSAGTFDFDPLKNFNPLKK